MGYWNGDEFCMNFIVFFMLRCYLNISLCNIN